MEVTFHRFDRIRPVVVLAGELLQETAEVDLGSDDEGQITEGLGSTSAISAARERRERMQPFIELSKSSARKGGAHGFAGGEEDFQTPAASRVGGSSAKQRPPYYSGRR